MTLDGTALEVPWRTDPNAQRLCTAFEDAGFEIYFVGGCVRNACLGVPVTDVDMTTNATPDEMLALGKAEQLHAIPTGYDHGTITFVLDKTPFEVTTFRADVDTDGRHATVRFSQSIEEDAARRDFTMNALYADRHGVVRDPLSGMGDLKARRVRFIGSAGRRVAEDHLRSLRYFRFFAAYGDQSEGFDPEALDAIATHLDGLALLSKERITQELLKLLKLPEPVMAIAGMRQCGVLGQILEGADDTGLGPLVHWEQSQVVEPNPIERLAALGGWSVGSLKLSKAQNRLLETYRNEIGSMRGLAELAYRLGADTARAIARLRAALLEMPLTDTQDTDIAVGASVNFPVKAADLQPEFEGRALGQQLKELEAHWIASNFTLTKEDLLS